MTIVAEELRIAGDDGSGDARDWDAWTRETDGMGEGSGHGKLYVMDEMTQPLGRAGVFGVAPGMSRDVYVGPLTPRFAQPREIGGMVLRGQSPDLN